MTTENSCLLIFYAHVRLDRQALFLTAADGADPLVRTDNKHQETVFAQTFGQIGMHRQIDWLISIDVTGDTTSGARS